MHVSTEHCGTGEGGEARQTPSLIDFGIRDHLISSCADHLIPRHRRVTYAFADFPLESVPCLIVVVLKNSATN